jgi:glycosyltransferase involved in cell wall biosynthesis
MLQSMPPEMMRIGLDGSCLSGRLAGVGRYVFELCRALDTMMPDARFFVYTPSANHALDFSDRWTPRGAKPVVGPFWKTRWLMHHVPRFCARDNLDIFWATTTLAPHLPANVKIVTTVYDLNHLIVPETMRISTRWEQRLFFTTSLKKASAITTISKGTADRLSRLLGLQATAVVMPGVSAVFSKKSDHTVTTCRGKYNLDLPYLLSVATKEPRKNLELLIRTFVRMKNDRLLPAHRLVLVGDSGWPNTSLLDLLREVPSDSVASLGYIPDCDLAALYSGADALVFPSVYEGFGIPLVEARACGTRIVSTDSPELREAGGAQCVYVQATEEGLREGILKCLDRPQPATELCQLPTWNANAATLAKVFLEVMKATRAETMV